MLSSEPISQFESMQRRIVELESRLAEQERLPVDHTRRNGHHLAEREARLSSLEAAFESLSEGVIICDQEGRLLHFNPIAEEMFGHGVTDDAPVQWSARYGLYQLDGVTPLPASELPLVRALRGERVQGVELITRTAKRPEGLLVECSARPLRDAVGALCGAVVVCRDVSDRERYRGERAQRLEAEAQRSTAEKDRMQMAAMLRVLLDNLDIIVWACDEKGDVTFHDGRGADAANLARGQLVGHNLYDLYPEEGSSGAVRKAMTGVSVHTSNEAHGVSWEHWHIPVHGDGGAVTGLVGMSLDVTATRKAKAELEAKLALIERQQEVIRNLETPIIQVWDRVLTLPMVGVVDSRRTARVMDDLLAEISRTQAHFAILDLTGVDVVDTSTAGHMLGIINAVRLLGAEGIITGIRPNVAQTVVSLGLDLSKVTTLATLRDGLALAMRKLGAEGARTSPLRAAR